MLTFKNKLGAGILASAMVVVLSGCQKQEGPAERAGKEVDQAMDKAGESIEKAGENLQDAAKGEKK